MGIYYISGTGNSLHVARTLGNRLDMDYAGIASMDKNNIIDDRDDVTVVVSPLYDFKVPEMVMRFADQLKLDIDRRLYIVITCGINPLDSLEKMKKQYVQAGHKVVGGYAIHMPYSGIGSGRQSQSFRSDLLHFAEKRSIRISQDILNGVTEHMERGTRMKLMCSKDFLSMIPSLVKMRLFIVRFGYNKLAYTSDHNCNGCGVCAKVCPTKNIMVKENRAVYGDQCIQCFGCINWCPQSAISFGGHDVDIGHYHHPKVSIEDMQYQ